MKIKEIPAEKPKQDRPLPGIYKLKNNLLIVLFVAPKQGVVLVSDGSIIVGEVDNGWKPYTDGRVWEPCNSVFEISN